MAWESSIYYWSVIPKAANNKEDLNYYVKKYECGYVAEEHSRAGDINNYIIVESPNDKIPNYDILKIGVAASVFSETAPVRSVGRAKYYMSYYEEEDIIWQFSQDILDNWVFIPSLLP